MDKAKSIKVNTPIADIPTPNSVQVKKYLESWKQLGDYPIREKALNKLFKHLCPENKKIDDVLLKTSTLNDFYQTRNISTSAVAKHILELDIDELLQKGCYQPKSNPKRSLNFHSQQG